MLVAKDASGPVFFGGGLGATPVMGIGAILKDDMRLLRNVQNGIACLAPLGAVDGHNDMGHRGGAFYARAGLDCLAGEQNIGPAFREVLVLFWHGWYAGGAWMGRGSWSNRGRNVYGLCVRACARALVVRGGAGARAKVRGAGLSRGLK